MSRGLDPTLERLTRFYGHLADLARGYVKDAEARDDQVRLVGVWQADVERLLAKTEAPMATAR